MHFNVSQEQLPAFASQFWEAAGESTVFAFHGEMGAGKTTLINALCRAKGVRDAIASPTFSIINEYVFYANGTENKIYHMDLYRLKDEEEVVQAGVEDCLYSGAICLVEWPEKAADIFPSNTIHIYIKQVSEKERSIEVKMPAVL